MNHLRGDPKAVLHGAPVVKDPFNADCNCTVNVMHRLWCARVACEPLDSSQLAAWGTHVRACTGCRGLFDSFGSLLGFGTVETPEEIPIVIAPQDSAACLSMLKALKTWAGRKRFGGNGAEFEPEITQHLCWCRGCQEMFELFRGQFLRH